MFRNGFNTVLNTRKQMGQIQSTVEGSKPNFSEKSGSEDQQNKRV